jgi:hypothetical protein
MPTRGRLLISLVFCAACTGEINGGGDDVGPDGGGDGVAFTSPDPGSLHPRDFLADTGWLVADVPVAVAFTPGDTVEISMGDEVLGTVDSAGELTALVRGLGPVTLTARALRGGEEVGTDTLDLSIVEPTVADCHGWLDLYELSWEVGDPAQGVGDPIVLNVPVNGMSYRYSANTTPRASFTVMSCELAVSLAEAAPMLRARNIVEVVDIGVYNYRCIGEGTPPDCPQGMSQHAYAKAIDIAGFTDDLDTFYSVNDDWVIDPDGEDTCAAPTIAGADAFLHETICELKAAGVWNIVLTPNYNSAHRNHFHVDLTPGSDFIGHGPLVDSGPDNH